MVNSTSTRVDVWFNSRFKGTNDLLVRVVSYEPRLFLAYLLRIFKKQLEAYDNICSLSWLYSTSAVTGDVGMLEPDLHLYQRGRSWDPGGFALLLIIKLTRQEVFQGPSCAMILVL